MLMMAVSCAFADDIVTMPTANQLKAGQVDAAAYYLTLHVGALPNPQFVQYQTLYLGRHGQAGDRCSSLRGGQQRDRHYSCGELQAPLGEPPAAGPCGRLPEPRRHGDLPRQSGTTAIDERAKSEDHSYFLSAAKTFFFNAKKPGPPLVRVHLSVGTEDWTLLGEKRHEGIFGGLQFLLLPDVGLVVENDGQDTITGLTYMPKNTGLTFKGGTFGKNSWVGVAYRTSLNF